MTHDLQRQTTGYTRESHLNTSRARPKHQTERKCFLENCIKKSALGQMWVRRVDSWKLVSESTPNYAHCQDLLHLLLILYLLQVEFQCRGSTSWIFLDHTQHPVNKRERFSHSTDNLSPECAHLPVRLDSLSISVCFCRALSLSQALFCLLCCCYSALCPLGLQVAQPFPARSLPYNVLHSLSLSLSLLLSLSLCLSFSLSLSLSLSLSISLSSSLSLSLTVSFRHLSISLALSFSLPLPHCLVDCGHFTGTCLSPL